MRQIHTTSLVIFLLSIIYLSSASALTLEASFTSGVNNGWTLVERWKDTSGNLTAENYPGDGRGQGGIPLLY